MKRWAFALLSGFLIGGCAVADARNYFAQGAPVTRDAAVFGLARSEENDWIVLRDARPCGGGGVYKLRKGAVLPLAITAPHALHDRGTGELAMSSFARSRAAVAAQNTIARDGSDGCEALDVARDSEHLFTQFALGFSDRFPNGLVVQLHGFDGERRSTARAQEAAAIVSNGTPSPDAQTLDLADCLSRALAPRHVLVYPTETSDLGGEHNAQGQALREANGAGFVHIELAAETRAAMTGNAELFEAFTTCLEGAAA